MLFLTFHETQTYIENIWEIKWNTNYSEIEISVFKFYVILMFNYTVIVNYKAGIKIYRSIQQETEPPQSSNINKTGLEMLLDHWKESCDKPRQRMKKQRHDFADKVCMYNQSYGFSSSHVQVWETDHKEGWGPKNWYFQIVVLEMTREFLGHQGDPTSQSQRKQPWISIGKTDTEAETPLLGVPILFATDAKSGLIEKDPDAGKDWGPKEKTVAEGEMVR